MWILDFWGQRTAEDEELTSDSGEKKLREESDTNQIQGSPKLLHSVCEENWDSKAGAGEISTWNVQRNVYQQDE